MDTKSVAKGYFKHDFKEIFHWYIPKAQAQALPDELKVAIQPPKAEEDSASNPACNLVHRQPGCAKPVAVPSG